jgi:hypothetical protein
MELVPALIHQLRLYLTNSWSSDAFNNVCSYLTSTLPKGNITSIVNLDAHALNAKAENDFSEMRKERAALTTTMKALDEIPTLLQDAKQSSSSIAYHVKVRNGILEMLYSMIADDSVGPSLLAAFSTVVSPRWTVTFCSPRLDQHTIVLGVEILCQSYLWNDKSTSARYAEAFTIAAHVLESQFHVMPIYTSFFAVLVSLEQCRLANSVPYETAALLAIYGRKSGHMPNKDKKAQIEACRVLIRMTSRSIGFVTKWSSTLLDDPQLEMDPEELRK